MLEVIFRRHGFTSYPIWVLRCNEGVLAGVDRRRIPTAVTGLELLDPAFRHHGGSRAGVRAFVNPTIDDSYALQILLHDLFARQFDILIGVSTGPFAYAVDHVFFHKNAYLFRQIRAS